MPNLKCKDEILAKNPDTPIIEEVEVKGSFSTYLEVYILNHFILNKHQYIYCCVGSRM